MSLYIGEVAAKSGLSHDTLRYYERIGLVPPTRREAGGRRVYEESVLDQLAVVSALRAAQFSIEQVQRVVGVKEQAATVRGRIAAMRAALDDLEQALAEKEQALRRARAQLESWREELDSGEPWPDDPIGCGDGE